MSTLSLTAIGIALAALVGLCFGLPDPWFCGLLALACFIGGLDAAYRGLNRAWPVAFLVTGAALCGAAVHALITGRRGRETP